MSGTEHLVIGWTCDDCDEAIGDEPRMWDLAEKFRKEHEEETGHTTTVEVVDEKRILPSQADRMDLGEHVIEIADAEVDWICPECSRSGEDLGTTRRCPDCDERLREVLPDGGNNRSIETDTDRDDLRTDGGRYNVDGEPTCLDADQLLAEAEELVRHPRTRQLIRDARQLEQGAVDL